MNEHIREEVKEAILILAKSRKYPPYTLYTVYLTIMDYAIPETRRDTWQAIEDSKEWKELIAWLSSE